MNRLFLLRHLGVCLAWLLGSLTLLIASLRAAPDAAPVGGAGRPITVLILAGQSDILNWHADASLLPSDPLDASIRFYFHTGAPPLHPRMPRNFFNATSGDTWTTLRPQTQDPYHKYFRTFFGPEMTLCRRLARRGTEPLALIKVGYFGTNLAEDWHPRATSGNQLYALFHRQVSLALRRLKEEGWDARVAGFFWMQGGSDGARAEFAARYGENLALLVARMRADFATAQTPFILARTGPVANAPHREAVRQGQVHFGSTDPRAAWIDTDDLPLDTDGVHLIAPGIITLGERMADAWLKLTISPPR